jgi:hypothetical protein
MPAETTNPRIVPQHGSEFKAEVSHASQEATASQGATVSQ